jgi:hypothetical protein
METQTTNALNGHTMWAADTVERSWSPDRAWKRDRNRCGHGEATQVRQDYIMCQFETIAEHNCWTRLEKSTYLFTALRGQATDMLHKVPKGATYEETRGALEDRFGDQHLAVVYRSELKARTLDVRSLLQEFATPSNTWPTLPTLHYPRTM